MTQPTALFLADVIDSDAASAAHHGAAAYELRRLHEEVERLTRERDALLAEPYRLPDDLYDSKDWRAGDYAERVAWLHAMYESAKKERDALLYPPEPLWPPTGLEPRGCPLPGACSCPSKSARSTHSEDCWQWHQACAVAAVIRLRAEVARLSKRDGE